MAGALGVVITTDVPMSGQHAQPVYVDDSLPIVGPSRAIVVTSGEVPQMGGPPMAVRLAPAGTPAIGPALPVYVVSGSLNLTPPPGFVSSGLLARYIASDVYSDTACTAPISIDNTAARGWKDQTGNGLHATQAGVSGICPVYRAGSPAYLEFSGVNQYFDTPAGVASDAQALTIVLVMQFDAVNTTQDPADLGPNMVIPRLKDGQISAWKNPNNHPTGIIPSAGEKLIWHSASGASDFRATVNGISMTASLVADSDSVAGGYLGRSSANNYLNGRIYEVLIYSVALTAEQIAQNETYFAVAYSITPSTPTKVIVFKGDSLTQASLNTVMYDSYPAQVMRNRSLETVAAYNLGVSSQTVATMITNGVTEVDSLFSAGGILAVWGGTNDLALGASAATVYGRIVSYCQARQSAGWKVVIATILPRSDPGLPGTFEADRQTVNASIRANYLTFADGLADVAADADIGIAGAEEDTDYYEVDLVHLNDAGLAIAAFIFQPAINELLDGTGYPVLLRDTFTTAQSAPLSSPRAADVGTFVISDTGNNLSISSGALQIAGGSGWNNPGDRLQSTISRASGRALLCTINKASGGTYGPMLGWSTATGLDMDSAHFDQGGMTAWATNQFVVRVAGVATQIGAFSTSTDYIVAIILHTSGWIACVAGGAYATFPQMTVLHISTVVGTDDFYAALTTFNGPSVVDTLRAIDLGGVFARDSYYGSLVVADVVTLPNI